MCGEGPCLNCMDPDTDDEPTSSETGLQLAREESRKARLCQEKATTLLRMTERMSNERAHRYFTAINALILARDHHRSLAQDFMLEVGRALRSVG